MIETRLFEPMTVTRFYIRSSLLLFLTKDIKKRTKLFRTDS